MSHRPPGAIIRDRVHLEAVIASERREGRTVALANGCFDLLHQGHLGYLYGASREADVLVVAINSDESVRRIKGPGRPLQPEDDRADIISSIVCVDYVTIFDEPTADAILHIVRPHVHAKGTDWTADTVPELATVKEIGGRVAIVGGRKRRSSTDLIQRVRALELPDEGGGGDATPGA